MTQEIIPTLTKVIIMNDKFREEDHIQKDIDIPEALNMLKEKMKEDKSYAWRWCCNIAVPMQDEGISYELSNKIATKIMKHLFEVDISEDILLEKIPNDVEKDIDTPDIEELFKTIIMQNSVDDVLNEIQEAKYDYIDTSWEDEFEDIDEAYLEQGRGEAESQILTTLINSHGGINLNLNDHYQLFDQLTEHYDLTTD